MKKIIFSILALSIIICSSCQQKVYQEIVDVKTEKEAIEQVVQAGLDAFVVLSYEDLAEVWAHTPYVVRGKIVGWESLSDYYKEWFKNRKAHPEVSIKVLTAFNFKIYVNGNFASVFHEEHYETIRNGEERAWDQKMHKYLEKINGEWKVITLF